MTKLYNLAKMTTSTTGTGTITLGSAVTGFLTFAQAGVQNGDVVSYGIINGDNREVGYGTYTSSGTTLSRNVINSTNSNSLLSLSGSSTIFITALARDIPSEIDYVQRTSNYTLTTEDDYLVGNSVTYDGNTRIKIELFIAAVDGDSASAGGGLFRVYDGTTALNRIADVRGGVNHVVKGEIYLTPSSGAHTYKITATLVGSGTLLAYSGAVAGGSSTYAPSFMRITRA